MEIKVTSTVLEYLDGRFHVCEVCSSYMFDDELLTVPNDPYDIFVCSGACFNMALEDKESQKIEAAVNSSAE